MRYVEAGSGTVTFHAEAAPDPVRLAKDIRAAGVAGGSGHRPGHTRRAVPGAHAPFRPASDHDDQGRLRRAAVPAVPPGEGAHGPPTPPGRPPRAARLRSMAASPRTRSRRRRSPGADTVRCRNGGVQRARPSGGHRAAPARPGPGGGGPRVGEGSRVTSADGQSHHRILVVDDDEDIARFVEMNLVMEGFEVVVAHDGAGGLGHGAQDRPGPDHPRLDDAGAWTASRSPAGCGPMR